MSTTLPMHLILQVLRPAIAPVSGSLVPAAQMMLQHLQPIAYWAESEQPLPQMLQDSMQRQSTDQQWLQQVQDGLGNAESSQGGRRGSVMFATALEQYEQRQHQGVSTRQLLWEVLQQLKPAACHWYEAGAAHHQLQQGGAADAPASVPECTSPALWSTLTRSLASGLLLVPPGIRDLVEDSWAAGAGRLGACSDRCSSPGLQCSSSVAGLAARMLVVQYARAARRQYAQVWVILILLAKH
jgi:hypothetical protein